MPTQNKQYANLWVFEHPVIQDKLTVIRDKNTKHVQFRRLLNEIAGLMFFQLSRKYETKQVKVCTPVEESTGVQLANPITLVPILRAGIGMTDGILAMI
ncbi:MAG: uracil phosphoribosyltransferase, partial [Phycisphaerales bacterium]